MTDNGDARSGIDHAINDVAHGMTLGPAPDLRWRVAHRLDAGAPTIRWWQPALVVSMTFVAIMLAWSLREVPSPQSRQEQAPPAVAIRERAPLETPRVPGGMMSTRKVRPSRSIRIAANTSPDRTGSLPPIALAPVVIPSLDVEPSMPLQPANMPALVLEPLDVEPLPRSNR